MNKEFIPYEQARQLKELGFNATPIGGFKQNAIFYYEKGELYYDYRPMYSSTSHEGQILAPLYQQAFRFFREKYEITYSIDGAKDYVTVSIDAQEYGEYGEIDESYNSYEEAELACLKKLIELVKHK